MVYYSDRRIWEKRVKHYTRRGIGGLGASIARKELSLAARLWCEHIGMVDGWAVDIGAGNGYFWTLVEPPNKLLLMDIAVAFQRSDFGWRIAADAVSLPIRTGEINCIVALGLIEYITDIHQLFSDWRHLIKPAPNHPVKGKLLLSNSPPILPNKLRKLFGLHAIPRKDSEISAALSATGWKSLIVPVRVGWQSLFVAEAVE